MNKRPYKLRLDRQIGLNLKIHEACSHISIAHCNSTLFKVSHNIQDLPAVLKKGPLR
jgi:hypothetical protein